MNKDIDLDDPDFYENLKMNIESLKASIKEKKQKMLVVETKAAILSVEFASMLNSLKTKTLDDLNKIEK